MKPLFTKKNGTSQRVAAIEVKMPASYPSANVTYGSGSVENALDQFSPTAYRTDGITFTDCTLIMGGYLIIGNLFILNIRISIDVASSRTKQYLTIPKTATELSAVLAENATDDTAPIYSVVSQNGVYLKDTVVNKGYALFGIFLVK